MTPTTKDRVHKTDRYGKSSRFYEIGGKNYPSVTTILKAIDRPALIPWAARVEREACMETAWDIWQSRQNSPLTSREAFGEHFSLRLGKEKAQAKKMREAGDLGSEAHARIDWEIRKEMGQEVGDPPYCQDGALWAVMAHEDWRRKSNLAPVLVESVVYSERYGYAGTMDLAGTFDSFEHGRIESVIDTKTSVGIYPEMLLQVAAYAHALVEMGQAILPYGTIVRIPKDMKQTEFEVRVITPEEIKKLHKVFLATMDLWTWLEAQK